MKWHLDWCFIKKTIDKKGEVPGFWGALLYPKFMPSEAVGSPVKAMARLFTGQKKQGLKLLLKRVKR